MSALLNKREMVSRLVGLARIQAHRALDMERLRRSEVTGEPITEAQAERCALILRCEARGYFKAARRVKENLPETPREGTRTWYLSGRWP